MHFVDLSKHIMGNDYHFEVRKIKKICQRRVIWEKVQLLKKKRN